MSSQSTIPRMLMARDVLLALLDYVHGDVIDFGAGLSRQKPMILKKAKSYTAMDIQKFPGIDIVGDVLNPPLKDASYDTVFSAHVIEHVREPWTMVEQMSRVLRPGGTAIVMAPFMYPFHADPGDYFRFSEIGIRSLFERAGMKVEFCSKFSGFFGMLSEIVKQRFFSPYGKPRSWFKRRIFGVVEATFVFLNSLFTPGIVYANVVCVARKS